MSARSLLILASASSALFGALMPARADNCPDAKTAPLGFVVERGENSKTEVLRVGGTTVRTIYRYNGNTALETTQFQGLFELDRIDRGKRTTSQPINDLAKLFPLKVGQKLTGIFETTAGEGHSNRTITLTVKKADQLYIGACHYDVLQIDRSIRVEKGEPVFVNTDYYSPDLKLVIAKEFRNGGGATSLNKFDKIYLNDAARP
jgi:hypothetical protein